MWHKSAVLLYCLVNSKDTEMQIFLMILLQQRNNFQTVQICIEELDKYLISITFQKLVIH